MMITILFVIISANMSSCTCDNCLEVDCVCHWYTCVNCGCIDCGCMNRNIPADLQDDSDDDHVMTRYVEPIVPDGES